MYRVSMFILVIVLLSGCGTVRSAYEDGIGNRIFGGVRKDVRTLCALDEINERLEAEKAAGMTKDNPEDVYLVYPLLILDLPMSFATDTAIIGPSYLIRAFRILPKVYDEEIKLSNERRAKERAHGK